MAQGRATEIGNRRLLISVGIQPKLDREIAVADANLASAANRTKSLTAILEHPDIWARGTERLMAARNVPFPRGFLDSAH